MDVALSPIGFYFAGVLSEVRTGNFEQMEDLLRRNRARGSPTTRCTARGEGSWSSNSHIVRRVKIRRVLPAEQREYVAKRAALVQ